MVDKSFLAGVLSGLVELADRAPGHAAQRTLSRGLTISVVKCKAEGGYKLLLTRPDVFPSLQEWVTVLEHWPWLVTDVLSFSNVQADGRLGLLGSVPGREVADARLN